MRPIASAMSHAWSARNATVSAESVKARTASWPSARRWLAIVTPGRRGGMAASTGMSVGNAIVRTTNSVQISAT